MAFRRRYYSKPKPKARARKYITARKAVRKARKSNFVKAVKSVISSQAEDKHAHITTGNGLVYFNAGINSAGDMLQVLPNIAQGNLDYQRIGDQIKGKKLTINGFIRLTPNTENIEDTSVTNVVCRLMVLSLKFRNGIYSDAVGAAGNLNLLLKKGGTTSGFDGYLGDINAPVNSDVFTTHYDRKFYLTQDLMARTGTAALNLLAVNMKDIVKFFKISIPCKKLLKYDSGLGAGVQPINFSPFMVLGYSALDGSAPATLTTPVAMSYTTDFTYEDI